MTVKDGTPAVPAGFVRVPGFFRRAELDRIDKLQSGLHFVDAGADPSGEALVAVFQRQRPPRRQANSTGEVVPASVEVLLPDAPDGSPSLTVRYCDVCHRWGKRHSVHLCGVNWHVRLGLLLRELAADPMALDEGMVP